MSVFSSFCALCYCCYLCSSFGSFAFFETSPCRVLIVYGIIQRQLHRDTVQIRSSVYFAGDSIRDTRGWEIMGSITRVTTKRLSTHLFTTYWYSLFAFIRAINKVAYGNLTISRSPCNAINTLLSWLICCLSVWSHYSLPAICQSSNLPRSSSDSSPFESVRNKILSFFSSQVNPAKTLSGERQGTGAGLFIGRPRISGIWTSFKQGAGKSDIDFKV